MDDVFRDLEKAGKTDVENLIKWLKDCKYLDIHRTVLYSLLLVTACGLIATAFARRTDERSKVIEISKEEKVRKLFNDSVNQQQVELQQFKEIIVQLAQEQSKTIEQLSKQLADEGPRIIDAAIVGLKAFKEALEKDK